MILITDKYSLRLNESHSYFLSHYQASIIQPSPPATFRDSLHLYSVPLLHLLVQTTPLCSQKHCLCPVLPLAPLPPRPRCVPPWSRAPVSWSQFQWPWPWNPKTGSTRAWRTRRAVSQCPIQAWRGRVVNELGRSEGLMWSWGESQERALGSSLPLRMWRMAKVRANYIVTNHIVQHVFQVKCCIYI